MIKKTLILVFSSIFAVLILLMLAVSLIDMSKYIPIANIVKTATGKDIIIDGSVRFNMLPSPRISISEVRVLNPDTTFPSDQPLLSIDKAFVAIDILPLFKKKLIIKEVTLLSPNIKLLTLMDSRNNWSFSSNLPKDLPADDALGSVDPKELYSAVNEKILNLIEAFSLQNISIKNGSFALSEEVLNEQGVNSINRIWDVSGLNLFFNINTRVLELNLSFNGEIFDVKASVSDLRDILIKYSGSAELTVNSSILKAKANSEFDFLNLKNAQFTSIISINDFAKLLNLIGKKSSTNKFFKIVGNKSRGNDIISIDNTTNLTIENSRLKGNSVIKLLGNKTEEISLNATINLPLTCRGSREDLTTDCQDISGQEGIIEIPLNIKNLDALIGDLSSDGFKSPKEITGTFRIVENFDKTPNTSEGRRLTMSAPDILIDGQAVSFILDTNGTKRNINLKLEVGRFNLDNYIINKPMTDQQINPKKEAFAWSSLPFKIFGINEGRYLALSLKAKELTFKNIKYHNISNFTSITGSGFVVYSSIGNLLDGSLTAEISGSQKQKSLKSNLKVSNISVEKLSKALFDAKLLGTLDGSYVLQTQGESQADFAKNLSGNLVVDIKNLEIAEVHSSGLGQILLQIHRLSSITKPGNLPDKMTSMAGTTRLKLGGSVKSGVLTFNDSSINLSRNSNKILVGISGNVDIGNLQLDAIASLDSTRFLGKISPALRVTDSIFSPNYEFTTTINDKNTASGNQETLPVPEGIKNILNRLPQQ